MRRNRVTQGSRRHPRRLGRAFQKRRGLLLEALERRILLAAEVTTDKLDYAPAETALISASGYQAGETVEFEVDHIDAAGNVIELGGQGHDPWQVTDGSPEDLDGQVDGNIQTEWYVNPDDSLNETFKLTAEGLSSGEVASTTFTDSLPGDSSVDLTTYNSSGEVNGAIFTTPAFKGGTGIVNPFVRIQKNNSEQGYNSGADGLSSPNPQFDETGKYNSQYNTALPLASVPIIYLWNPTTVSFEAYREFRLDINENSNANGQQYLSLDALQIYESSSAQLYSFTGSPTLTGTFTDEFGTTGQGSLAYNLDSGTDNWVALNYDLYPGSGVGDVSVFVPDSVFSGDGYVYLYSAFGNETSSTDYLWESSDGFEEWSVSGDGALAASDLSGSKFHDANGDGVFNTLDGDEAWSTANGYSPIQVYLDQNQNQTLDWTDGNANDLWDSGEGERWVYTDENGDYVFTDLPAGLGTDSTFYVREVVPTNYAQTGPLDGTYATGVVDEDATVSSFTISVALNSAGVTYNLPAFGNELVFVPDPSYTIAKTITSVVTANAAGEADDAGDVINYQVVVTNTGNIDLTGVSLSDSLGASVTIGSPVESDAGGDAGVLDVGENWTYTYSYTVTQDDLDSKGDAEPGDTTADDDGKIENTATVSSNELGDQSSSADQPLDYSPAYTIAKTITSVVTANAAGEADDAGDVINYQVVVTNTGNIDLTGVSLSDSLTSPGPATETGGTGTHGDGILDIGESWTYSYSYTVTQSDIDFPGDDGAIDNTATVSSNELPDASDSAEEPVIQDPEIQLVKTFTEDSVIAGGAGSSFTLVVTNTGNVTLSDALIQDTVDPRLTVPVNGVSGTLGADADSDANNQTVEWLISSLAPNQSETITVSFAAVPGAVGNAPIGDNPAVEATVLNTANVAAEAPQGDDIIDNDMDTIDVRRDINLSIEKAFDPEEIEIPIQPQGTGQFFTITVSNAGLSDADNVLVTDTVNGFLEIVDVTIDPDSTDNSVTWAPTIIDPGAPPPLIATELEASIDIPAGDSVTITVEYIVAPFLSGDQIYGDGTGNGSEFRFVFDNGSILEGNALGAVYLDGVEITAEGEDGLTKNDYLFDPDGPGGEDAFPLHLSCSDPFTGGWGQSGGPDEVLNPEWQIDYFSIARYKQGGEFFRNCGNVVDTFDVDNSATATGIDYFPDPPDNDTVSDVATVTIKEGILMDHYQRKAKHASVDLTNFTGDPKVVRFVELEWPTSNESLRQITLGGLVIWQGNAPGEEGAPGETRTVTIGDLYSGDPVPPDYDPTPWLADLVARELDPNVTEKLTFHFTEKAGGDAEYQIRSNFDDGTFLDITIDQDTRNGGKGKALTISAAADAAAHDGNLLSDATLADVTQQAIAHWASQGVDAHRLNAVSEADVQISDISGPVLGLAYTGSNRIQIDRDAAGFGWNNVDLLSTVTHEFGHLLGYDHDVMGHSLQVGGRYLPTLGDHDHEDAGLGLDRLASRSRPADQLFGLLGRTGSSSTPGRVADRLEDYLLGDDDFWDHSRTKELGFLPQDSSQSRRLARSRKKPSTEDSKDELTEWQPIDEDLLDRLAKERS